MKLLSFYNGLQVNLDVVTIYPAVANTITFNFIGGATQTYTAVNVLSVLTQIAEFAASSSTSYTVDDGCILYSVTPTEITPLSAGTSIAITGRGFDAATLGTIHIEDTTGGMDDNGVSFTPTFVDSQNLTAVWASNGDDDGPFVWLYYRDSNGVPTNILVVNAH